MFDIQNNQPEKSQLSKTSPEKNSSQSTKTVLCWCKNEEDNCRKYILQIQVLLGFILKDRHKPRDRPDGK